MWQRISFPVTYVVELYFDCTLACQLSCLFSISTTPVHFQIFFPAQVWCDFQYGTASCGWFQKWIWERSLVEPNFQWIQSYNLDGGIKPWIHGLASVMVDEVCWQYCEGDCFYLWTNTHGFVIIFLLKLSFTNMYYMKMLINEIFYCFPFSLNVIWPFSCILWLIYLFKRLHGTQ